VKNNIISFLSLIIGLFFLGLLPACDENLPEVREKTVKVDFRDLYTHDMLNKQETFKTERPVLKVTIGTMISPKYIEKYYWDLFRLVGDRMNLDIDFIQRGTYAETNELLKQRKVDIAFVCSGPYVQGHADFGMEIIAVPVSQGVRKYHSYFIVNRNSAIQNLSQLRNKIFAYTDPGSNTGCLVATYYLTEYNERPESFFKQTFFTYSHDNSIKAVAEGLADGASVHSLIWNFLNIVNPALTSRTRIIETSFPYGMPPIVVHPLMEEDKKEKLRTLFFTLHEDPEGIKILNSMLIDRFEPGNDAEYSAVREMLKVVNSNTG
jgi:phosphonate transport system substrate-binding protein